MGLGFVSISPEYNNNILVMKKKKTNDKQKSKVHKEMYNFY